MDDRVTGYVEVREAIVYNLFVVLIPKQTQNSRTVENAQTSTSLLRAPAPTSTFVRGKSGYLPFKPGGLDDVILAEDDRPIASGSKGLRTIPPGFSRGLDFGDDHVASLVSDLPDVSLPRHHDEPFVRYLTIAVGATLSLMIS